MLDSRDKGAALDLFMPEAPVEPSVQAPAAVFAGVSVADVVGRGTPVAWDEAVAVIEELCVVLGTSERGRGAGLRADDVLIGRDGHVALARRLEGPASPAEVARVLHTLLESAQVPVALRLLVTATHSGTYRSTSEFAAALAYYGKPGRGGLVAALYARCIALPPAQSDAGAAAPRNAPMLAPPRLAAWSRRITPRMARSAAAGVALAAIGLTGWYVVNGADRDGGGPAFTVAGAVSAIEDLGRELRDQPRIRLAPAPGAAASTPPGVPPTGAPTVTRPGAATPAMRPADGRDAPSRAAAAASGIAIVTIESVTGGMVPSEGEPPAPAAPVLTPAAVPAPNVPAAAAFRAPAAGGVSSAEPVAYSRADVDVQPPVLLYPQQPPALIPDTPPSAMNAMELLVSEDGTVEHVRIVAGPRRMPDMMLLSGAKMWRFKPALKDGQPVRYRTTISWSGLP